MSDKAGSLRRMRWLATGCVLAAFVVRVAAAFLPDEDGARTRILDFAAGTRAVSKLLFQALDQKRVSLAIGHRAQNKETRHSLVGPRQSKKSIAHRSGAEPLVTG